MANEIYQVTRLFVGGVLAGMTHTGTTNRQVRVGWECYNPIGGSPYRIVSCVKIQ